MQWRIIIEQFLDCWMCFTAMIQKSTDPQLERGLIACCPERVTVPCFRESSQGVIYSYTVDIQKCSAMHTSGRGYLDWGCHCPPKSRKGDSTWKGTEWIHLSRALTDRPVMWLPRLRPRSINISLATCTCTCTWTFLPPWSERTLEG